MKSTTFEEISRAVAEEVMKSLEVNEMPLAEFIVKVDRVADFLKNEIRICEERLNEEPSTYYDGADVGFHNSEKLTLNHKRFCKKLLEIMNF